MDKLEQMLEQLQNTIKANGSPQAHSTSYNCPKCKDTEWILNSETNSARPCDCREANRYKKLIDSSGISEAFRKKTFDNYETIGAPKAIKAAKEIAEKYAEDFDDIKGNRRNSIALVGQVGSGKTHLSLAIANDLLNRKIGVLYMQYREAIVQLKQNVTDQEAYQSQINRYKAASVLLIDDLYKGKITEADHNIMFEIINFRYLTGSPIIISSEFSTDRLLDFDEAIGSRIIEMCRGRIIEFEGQELNHRLIV